MISYCNICKQDSKYFSLHLMSSSHIKNTKKFNKKLNKKMDEKNES